MTIGSIRAYTTAQTSTTHAPNALARREQVSTPKEQGTQSGSQHTLSTLARQLADSASKADVRDNTLSRTALADFARTTLAQIQGEAYLANKAQHDNEIPATDNPDVLARAKQATAFVNDADQGKQTVSNPFSGLSRDQLALIVYDDSGTYTVNERRAAASEADKQEEAWRVQLTAHAMNEYNQTGKLTQSFAAGLEHYRELPAIEQAQYPADYERDLESKIKSNVSYRASQTEANEGALPNLNLFDILFP